MSIIAQRYARALMNLAVKENNLDEVAQGLDDLADSIQESELLTALLADAKIPQSTKQNTIKAILDQAKVAPLVETFVRFITKKRRVKLLPEMREVFHRLADERMGRAQAEVTVAANLDKGQEEEIRSKLETLSGKKITLTVKVDPEIIGGAITRIGSTVRDGSLRSHLNQIRQTISEG